MAGRGRAVLDGGDSYAGVEEKATQRFGAMLLGDVMNKINESRTKWF
jgi:hypothetical protein